MIELIENYLAFIIILYIIVLFCYGVFSFVWAIFLYISTLKAEKEEENNK